MELVTEDAILIFTGIEGNTSLFALEADGDIVEIFDPNTFVQLGNGLSAGGSMSATSTFFTIFNDALHFRSIVSTFLGSMLSSSDTEIMRLNPDGTLEQATVLPNFTFGNFGIQDHTEVIGDRFFLTLERAGDSSTNNEIFSLDADYNLTQETNLVRPGASGVLPGVVSIEDELLFVADQRSPIGPAEISAVRPAFNGTGIHGSRCIGLEPTGHA